MKKEFVTYSEAFKMQVVEETRQDKFASILQAQKAYGICGMTTIQKWCPIQRPKKGQKEYYSGKKTSYNKNPGDYRTKK